MQPALRLAGLVLLTAAVGCASSSSSKPSKAGRGKTERGKASWYGEPFHGRRTANGEVYDMNGVSAAHKTLPFDTRVRVDNLDNGQSMVVRINDRGPFIKGRIIDLSLGAARQIDLVEAGVAEVRLTVVEKPTQTLLDEDFAGTDYRLQVGAFLELSNAEVLAEELDELYTGVEINSDGRWHRVQIVGLTTSSKVQKTLADLRRDGHDAILIQ